MKYVSKAKNIYEKETNKKFPKVHIRITDDPVEKVLAVSTIGKDNIIWIPERSANMNEEMVQYITYHELIHTLFNFDQHSERGLMSTSVPRSSPAPRWMDQEFLSYVQEFK